MGFKYGGGGWKPNNRRTRREGRQSRRSTERGADRTFILILVAFTAVALVLAVAIGLAIT
jgi:hypothetical protein